VHLHGLRIPNLEMAAVYGAGRCGQPEGRLLGRRSDDRWADVGIGSYFQALSSCAICQRLIGRSRRILKRWVKISWELDGTVLATLPCIPLRYALHGWMWKGKMCLYATLLIHAKGSLCKGAVERKRD